MDNTLKKLKTGLIEEILKSHTILVESVLENPKYNILLLNQRRKNSYRSEEVADKWQHFIEELYSDSEELEDLEREEEITPKDWMKQ